MVKMLVLDLDGTLLDDAKNISSYNLSILDECKKRGIKIVIATARGERPAKRCADLVKPDFQILNGGALILRNDGEIIDQKFLSAETSDGIILECLNNRDTGYMTAEAEDGYYVSYTDPYHSDYSHGIYCDFLKPLGKRVYKLTIEILKEETAREIGNKFPECKMTGFTGENIYRFAQKEAEKMSAVKIVAGTEKIMLDEIAAFGDDYSDIEMINGCGFGVAMGNGIDEIKKAAKYICGNNNENGVGKWLEKHVLSE
jgi:Cof subfamily protein (haloacid dehalogenase superfamily)